jgi:hypothetical protein
MLKGKYPDREFFWSVVSTILPSWSEEYIDQVVNQRKKKKKEFPDQKVISISQKWIDKLSKFDYETNSK